METIKFADKELASNSFSSVEWLNFQAVSRHKEGKFEEAVSYYLEAIEIDTNQPDWVYANLITLLGKIKHFDESKQIEKLALGIYPQSSEIYRSLGENARESQDIDESLVYFKKALKIDVNQPNWVYTILAEHLFQNQDIAASNKLARQGIELHPDCYSLHKIVQKTVEQNVNVENLSELESGTVNVKTSFAFNPRNANQDGLNSESTIPTKSLSELIESADDCFDAGNFNQALFEYKQVVNLDSENHHGLLRTGDCAFRLGNYDEAEEILTRLLSLNPQSYWGLVCLGEVYFEQAKFRLAIETLEKAIAIDQENVWPIVLIGKSYKSLENVEQALLYFQQVVEIAPHQDVGYISMAEVYHQQKQLKAAQSNWLKAIEINSQNKWATVSLGYSYLEEKQIEQAEEFFTAKKDLFPNDFDFIFAFAHVYISKMDWKRAEAMMTEALTLNPDSSEIKVRLLELCLYSGNLTQAYEYYLSLQDNLENLPNSFYQAAAKLFSEQKNWALAFKYAQKAVLIEPTNIHNHKLFIKTVRKSKKFTEALNFLLDPAIINDDNKNTVLYLRIAIQEQLVKSIPEAQKVLSSRTIGLDKQAEKAKLLQKRLSIKSNIFNTSIAITSQLQTEIFYCTDLGYSLPTLVSIYSLYKNNKHQIRGKTIYVVANGETINIISKAYNKLAEKFDFEIELIDIGSLVKGSIDNQLNTSYGVFTGGDSLSTTAYYRLFFSQFLRDYGLSSRWLYIDSDTLIVNSIKAIDNLNFFGLPIAARQERPKPEVLKTIEINNLQHGKYFNSGVIAFDAQHPDLSRLAANAVSVAMNEGHKLLYHDQCALNIAFDGQIANLETQFNDYYPPSDLRNIEELSLSSQSVILHLLDRPKPWDTLSYHQGSIIWFKMLEEIATFIPSSYILELFQLLQNTL